MSKLLYDTGIFISTYAGPVRPDGGPRKRVQITSRGTGYHSDRVDDEMISLNMDEWANLHAAVLALGPDCEGPEL